MEYIPHIIGSFGVLAFVISYLHHTRKGILAFSILARTLFVIQYIMISAFEGAMMNGVGIICAVLADNKEREALKNKLMFLLIGAWILTAATGVMVWESAISIIPIIAMLLQNSALFMTKPKMIRILCLAGIPFWLTYNLISGAYSAVVSDILSAASMITAMITYDFKKDKE